MSWNHVINNINHIRQLVVELGTDEHAKRDNLSQLKRLEFYLSYVSVLVSMGSSASMRIRTSMHCCSMCSVGCGSSRRKSGGIVVVAAPAVPYRLSGWGLDTAKSHIITTMTAIHLWSVVNDSVYLDIDYSQEVIAKPKRDERPMKVQKYRPEVEF